MIIVSACLLGLNTKYDGKAHTHAMLQKYSTKGKFIPVCPEQLGGLPTPRVPVEIIGGTGQGVLSGDCVAQGEQGEVVTSEFILGAKEVLKIVELVPVTAAILKERSPSCGVNCIYDGSFSHRIISGQGVTAALLKEHNIPIYSEEELTEERLVELLERV
ncbi:DUF523 domain-containing protein [Desulfosporosinus sp. BICA1-9]|uniref:DUF523 domain-containing protein n=1 Tax=Desulfosporosinus sp. BICA1-9 TaxID=1531958 RepID=UPI00054B59CB|nr:DUF523 domain-containing protein [Desulfosporosinus sp. BICA1-9]KJS50048.1 MAG: hypothetical protein VR66_05150 [Peptococcaceae bacterium BRH_c23]KJS86353.1 MAG: hypothetical protein JL57_16560 [Desulfosporosinus sp. BICA1-9]HBW38648.1 DUF523 domain-containing protein [Desulfosporosinus sp.]